MGQEVSEAMQTIKGTTRAPTLGQLLKPPRAIPMALVIGLSLVAGLLVGMFWAYNLAPTEVINVGVYRLHPTARDQWVKFVAIAYYAKAYDANATISLLAQVEDPGGTVARLAGASREGSIEKAALQAVQGLATQAGLGTPAPQASGIFSDIIAFLVPAALLSAVTLVGALGWRVLRNRRDASQSF